MNPFLAFCLYVAARVFIQYLKSRKEDSGVKSSLHFLLAAMQVLKTKNPLTESFLVQLDVDLEGSGLDIPSHSRYKFGKRPPVENPTFGRSVFQAKTVQGEIPANTDAVHCSPLFEIRSTQGGTEMGQTTRDIQPPWPSDKTTPASNNSSESYPSMFNQQQQVPVNECAKVQKMGHLDPVTSFSGEDLLYGQPSTGLSPGYVHSEHPSNSSHSNQPTPASSSNRPGSYSNFTPPQPNQNAFSPSANGTSDQPLFGSNLGGNMGVPNPNDGSSWNFTAVHQNKSAQPHNEQPQQGQGGHGQDMGFGGTGMTPGATGMTPLPDSLWQSVNEGAGSEWMYGWNTGTPSQQ